MDTFLQDLRFAVRSLTLSLLAIFAVLAVALSAAGVYGVMSYGVSQRRREIGIRMALCARGGEVTSMVVRDAAKLAAIGVAIGLVAVAGLIGPVALAASLVPALRAARVDPLTAMRAE